MAINFLVNDPRSGLPPKPIVTAALRDHFGIGFEFDGTFPQRLYDPETEHDGFLFWQCRQSALLALHAWKNAVGDKVSLRAWQKGTKDLLIRPDAGRDLNADHDRKSISFFNFPTGNNTVFSGESCDVVAHELGHALFDTFRPDLWNTGFFEVAAFHESMGDCSALMAAFEDPDVRLAPGVLDDFKKNKANLVDAIAEDLSDAIKIHASTLSPGKRERLRNASAPRRAKNKFKREELRNLERTGDPRQLVAEVHSYSQVFTGCFYDLIVKFFLDKKPPSQLRHKHLREAAHDAGRLLVEGLRFARARPRFFEEVGQAMIFADRRINGGNNQIAIRDIFLRRLIELSVADTMPANQSLDGKAPDFGAANPTNALARETKRDLRERLGVTANVQLNYAVVSKAIQGQRYVEVSHDRQIPLQDVDGRLAGVNGISSETVRVGERAGVPRVLGSLPDTTESSKEVLGFVDDLNARDLIAFDRKARMAAQGEGEPLPTHAVKKQGGTQVLQRVRFSCCGHGLFL